MRERLDKRLAELGHDPAWLRRQLVARGIKPQTAKAQVFRWRAGRNYPNIESAQMLAEILGGTPADWTPYGEPGRPRRKAATVADFERLGGPRRSTRGARQANRRARTKAAGERAPPRRSTTRAEAETASTRGRRAPGRARGEMGRSSRPARANSARDRARDLRGRARADLGGALGADRRGDRERAAAAHRSVSCARALEA